MSIRLITQAWDVSSQKGARLLLLVALADNANDDGYAWPSIPTLARKSRMSERYVQMMLKDIEIDGEISVHEGEGPHGVNLYHIHPGVYRVWNTPPVKYDSPLPNDLPVNHTSPGGESPITGVVNHTSPKPSWNHHGTVMEPSSSPGAAVATVVVGAGDAKPKKKKTLPATETYRLLRNRKQPVFAAHQFADEDPILIAAFLDRVGPDYPAACVVADLNAGLHHPPVDEAVPAPPEPPNHQPPAWLPLDSIAWSAVPADAQRWLATAKIENNQVHCQTNLTSRLLHTRYPDVMDLVYSTVQGGGQ